MPRHTTGPWVPPKIMPHAVRWQPPQEQVPVQLPANEDEADRRPKPDCAVTFRNVGDKDIIVEPENRSNYGKSVLIPRKRSVTTNLYADNYAITLYSQGLEREFFAQFQRQTQRATSARITIGYDGGAKGFSCKIVSILQDQTPLFPPDELQAMNAKIFANSDDNSEEPDQDEDTDSDPVDDDYIALDIVFVVDAAYENTFLSSTVATIKSVLHDASRPFLSGKFRVALIVTRDYTDDGSEFELTGFTSNLAEFEQELDAVWPGGGRNGFCAFNAGMKEALGRYVRWRDDAERLVVVAAAGVPHGIGREKEDDDGEIVFDAAAAAASNKPPADDVDRYTVSIQDPIRMARRMSLLNIKLVFLTDAQLISSQDSRTLSFFKAMASMVPGAGVYQTGNPTVLRNYVASCMPDGWADTHTARVDEIRASETAAYRALTQIYAAANSLTSSDVREKLNIHDPEAVPMTGAKKIVSVWFTYHGRGQVYVECKAGRLRRTLLGSRGAEAKVETYKSFKYTLHKSKKRVDYNDRVHGTKTLDVSRFI